MVERAQALADDLRGTTDYTGDLAVPLDGEDDFRALLSGWLVRAYHATRLLDHEVQMMRTQGLRPLSVALVEERIDAAYKHSYISTEEREKLYDSHVFAIGEDGGRAGQCCFYLPKSVMANWCSGINPLLSCWGGESINMFIRGQALQERLNGLGRPAVVVAHIDLSAGCATHPVFPEIQKVFTARLLNLENVVADVFYTAPVPPHHVIAIWQPGDAEYDQFEGLHSC